MVCICKHCLKQYISHNKYTATCPECKSVDEMILKQISAYLKAYPNSNAIEIGEALGIKPMVIVKYIDEDRIRINRGTFSKIPD